MIDYSKCSFCGSSCKINRNESQLGVCRLSGELKISSFVSHHGEEPFISGSRGSGTIFLSGCNLSCVFCQNYQICHENQGTLETEKSFFEKACALLEEGVHNLNFVSPTPWLPHILKLIEKLRKIKEFKRLVTVYNSGGFDNPDLVEQISGSFKVWLPDAKYSESSLAKELSGVDNYPQVNRELLLKIFEKCAEMKFEDELMTSGICIRHLVLPGELKNTLGVIDFIADNFGDRVYLSLMSQYSPRYRAKEYPKINRTLRPSEYDKVIEHCEKKGLTNVLLQELSSTENYLPDFEKEKPF